MATTINKKVILTSAIGNILEYYDFAICGFLAPVIADKFFTSQNIELSTFLVYSVYAIGFIARPIGGIIFGHYGDKMGRKNTLLISIYLMGLTSLAVGLLPTYEDIGIAAAYILTIIRFLQGIALGGEYSGSVIFAMEHNQDKNICNFSGAIMATSTLIGCLLAAVVSSIFFNCEYLKETWRGPFLLGSLISLWGVYLRSSITETPEFIKTQFSGGLLATPIKELSKYKKEIVCSIFIIALTGINAGISTVFLNIYLTSYLHISIDISLLLISLSLVFYIIFAWVSGYINHLLAPYLMFTVCSLLLSIITPINFYILSTHTNFFTILAILSIFSSLSGILWGNVNQIVYYLFPSCIKYTSISISDSLGRTLFSSTAPLIANTIFTYYGSLIYVGIYISIFCIACMFLLLLVRPSDVHDQLT